MSAGVPARPLPGARYRTGQGPSVARTLRAPAADADKRLRWQVTAMGVFSFICGAFYLVKINFVGEIFVAEILLLIAGLAAALSGGARSMFRNPLFWALLVASVCSLAGYMLSDFVRGTQPALYMRGWARTAFIISSFVALSLILAADRRNLWWFAAGIAVGGILYLKFVRGLPLGANHHWKFLYSIPFTMLVACLAAFLPLRIVSLAMVALGAYSMFSDYRIHGAVCVLVGGLLWASGSTRLLRIKPAQLVKVGLLGAIGVAGALFVLNLSENEWTEKRRDWSNAGREVGARYGVHAILESPVIGYGSWANSAELIRISDEEIRAYEQRTGIRWHVGYGKGLVAHSQILQGWLEGGILAAGMYILLGFLLLREGALAVLRRPGDMLTPILLFLMIFQFWHLLASPLGSSVRLHFALAMALVAMLYAERKADERRKSPNPAPRQQVKYRRPGVPSSNVLAQ